MIKKIYRALRNKELLEAIFSPNINIEKKNYILIRNDDFSALSNPVKERKTLEIFEKYKIPQVVGVIPYVAEDFQNAYLNKYYLLEENEKAVELLKEYHKKQLIEIVQHGFTHQTNICHPDRVNRDINEFSSPIIEGKIPPYRPLNSEGYSEFKDLPYKIQSSKILMGRKYLEKLLNLRIETFIPPWNSLDFATLKALKNNGFNNVLCGNGVHKIEMLNVISRCQEDIFRLTAIVNEAVGLNRSVLIHTLYHSWMMSDEEIKALDAMLKKLSSCKDVKFILPRQLKEAYSQIDSIFKLSNLASILTTGNEISPHYLLDLGYYKATIYRNIVPYLFSKRY